MRGRHFFDYAPFILVGSGLHFLIFIYSNKYPKHSVDYLYLVVEKFKKVDTYFKQKEK